MLVEIMKSIYKIKALLLIVILSLTPALSQQPAPAVSKRISDGLFVFTPDASREEADEIVMGLNNVAKKMHGNWMHEQ